MLDHGRGQEVLVKEALHIQMTPSEERFNWLLDHCDEEAGRESNPHRPLTSNDVYTQ